MAISGLSWFGTFWRRTPDSSGPQPTGGSVFIFDLCIQAKAIDISGGQAINSDTGAVVYHYTDVKEKQGEATLPYG